MLIKKFDSFLNESLQLNNGNIIDEDDVKSIFHDLIKDLPELEKATIKFSKKKGGMFEIDFVVGTEHIEKRMVNNFYVRFSGFYHVKHDPLFKTNILDEIDIRMQDQFGYQLKNKKWYGFTHGDMGIGFIFGKIHKHYMRDPIGETSKYKGPSPKGRQPFRTHTPKRRNIIESIDDSEIFYSFIESSYNSDLLTDIERYILKKELISPKDYLIKENFYDSLKNRYQKASQVTRDMSSNAKEALKKLIDAASQATQFIKEIKDILDKEVSKILTITKDKIKSKLKANKQLIDAINKEISADKSAFLKDVRVMKEVTSFYKNRFKNSLVTSTTNGLAKLLTQQSTEIAESIKYLKESSNMISKFVHGLNSIPPFNWIDKLQKIGTQGSEYVIDKLSILTKGLGGPEFELPIIAIILGIAFEVNLKGLAKHGLLETIAEFSIPFLGATIKTVGLIATMIAVYELIVALVSGVEEEEKLHDFTTQHPYHHTTQSLSSNLDTQHPNKNQY